MAPANLVEAGGVEGVALDLGYMPDLVIPWQARFLRGLRKPDVRTAALSVHILRTVAPAHPAQRDGTRRNPRRVQGVVKLRFFIPIGDDRAWHAVALDNGLDESHDGGCGFLACDGPGGSYGRDRRGPLAFGAWPH